MKYSIKTTVALLLVLLSVIPVTTTFEPQMNGPQDSAILAGSIGWLDGWDYRRHVFIQGSSGAGTNYQVLLNVAYDSDMQANFSDLRFTDNDGVTELDYWIQTYTASTSVTVWVNVADNLDSAQSIYMYYGNSTVVTTSDGDSTFSVFINNTDTSGWTTSNIAVSASGDFLRFYNPTAGLAGEAQRWDFTTPADFQMMTQMKTVSLGALDQGTMILGDASSAHRFGQSYTPFGIEQAEWWFYDGATKWGGAWTEGTEYIWTVQVDEGDSSTGIDYRRYDTSWSLLEAILSEQFAFGSPTDCDGIYMGDASGNYNIDLYIRWLAIRKCIDTEPSPTIGIEQSEPWRNVGTVTFIFDVIWHPIFTFGYDMFFIFGGLILIPTSTMYLVKGGRKEMSSNKILIFLMLFMAGLGLFIGGIMP